MEYRCSLATVAANGEPALVGTTWILLCPLIYHLFIFFRFDFSLRHEQNANGAFFFISWNVFVELLYAHISQISNTTSRIPYSARASLLIATASLLRDTTSQFLLRIQPVSTESQLPLRIYMHLFPNFSPFPLPLARPRAAGERGSPDLRDSREIGRRITRHPR